MAAELTHWKGVRFQDGTRISGEPPRDTLDIRYAACHDHRTACDCREAELSEQLREYASELKKANEVFAEVLAGHNTWAYDPVTGDHDPMSACKCTGCEIARRTHFRPSYEVNQDRRDAGQPVYHALWRDDTEVSWLRRLLGGEG